MSPPHPPPSSLDSPFDDNELYDDCNLTAQIESSFERQIDPSHRFEEYLDELIQCPFELDEAAMLEMIGASMV